MIRFFQWVLGVLTALTLLYFLALNAQLAELNWSPANAPLEIPVYWIIFVTFISGYFIGLLYYWLSTLPSAIKSYKEKRDLMKKIEMLEEEKTS